MGIGVRLGIMGGGGPLRNLVRGTVSMSRILKFLCQSKMETNEKINKNVSFSSGRSEKSWCHNSNRVWHIAKCCHFRLRRMWLTETTDYVEKNYWRKDTSVWDRDVWLFVEFSNRTIVDAVTCHVIIFSFFVLHPPHPPLTLPSSACIISDGGFCDITTWENCCWRCIFIIRVSRWWMFDDIIIWATCMTLLYDLPRIASLAVCYIRLD